MILRSVFPPHRDYTPGEKSQPITAPVDLRVTQEVHEFCASNVCSHCRSRKRRGGCGSWCRPCRKAHVDRRTFGPDGRHRCKVCVQQPD